MNFLLIESDRTFADNIVRIIHEAGCNAEAVPDGNTGLAYTQSGLYNFVLLDEELPNMATEELVGRLKEAMPSLPIILLGTYKNGTHPHYTAVDAYLEKAQHSHEFLSSLREIVRNSGGAAFDEISFGDLSLGLCTHDLSCGSQSIHLSGKEFKVMELLMSSTKRIISKQELLASVWGATEETSENSAEAYISFLRKKLAQIDSQVKITTLRMLGYRLEMFGNDF